MTSARTITTQCCIAGGGPAGMMLGYLWARAGVAVAVPEKHAGILRDFRGDWEDALVAAAQGYPE